jgi:hypothetical protein
MRVWKFEVVIFLHLNREELRRRRRWFEDVGRREE